MTITWKIMRYFICALIIYCCLPVKTVAQEVHLPVELVYFTGMQKNNVVELKWGTATEVNNYGFEIQRSMDQAGPWELIGFVEGHGTIYSANDYSFTDTLVAATGIIYYRLLQIDTDGNSKHSMVITVDFKYTSVETAEHNNFPESFILNQNYPNPFNPSTNIGFSLSTQSSVIMKLYDMTGQELCTALEGVFPAGDHSIRVDMGKYPSGFYILSASCSRGTKTYHQTRVITLLK